MRKPLTAAFLSTAFLMPVTSGISWSDNAPQNADTTGAQVLARDPASSQYPSPPNPGWEKGPWGSPPAWSMPLRNNPQASPGRQPDIELDSQNTLSEPVAAATNARTGVVDSDRNDLSDSNGLCHKTLEVAIEGSTGCAVSATLSLEGVSFRYNSHELAADARLALDPVAGLLRKHADVRFEVAGHSDSQGNAAYNQWLSRQRALAVRDYLIGRGVDPENVTARGYGTRQPVADNTTVQGLVRNRRVELRRLP